MRIAEYGHKHLYESTGGIEVVVTELVKRLAADGNIVTVLDRGEIDQIAQVYPKTPNVRILRVPTLSNSKINAQAYSLGAAVQCLFDDYDVIHVHAEGPSVFMAILKNRCKSAAFGWRFFLLFLNNWWKLHDTGRMTMCFPPLI